MRFVEWGLMSLPAVIVAAWLLGVRPRSYRALAGAALGLALVGVLLFWMGDQRGFTGHYTPARLLDGRVVAGPGNS